MQKRGKVKWYDAEKGYGFITPVNGGGKDIFVHKSNIDNLQRSLENEELVEYEEGKGKKGPEAINVKSVNA